MLEWGDLLDLSEFLGWGTLSNSSICLSLDKNGNIHVSGKTMKESLTIRYMLDPDVSA